MIVSLVAMKLGETGVVTEIEGGHEARARIRGMGIRIGKKNEKTGRPLLAGAANDTCGQF